MTTRPPPAPTSRSVDGRVTVPSTLAGLVDPARLARVGVGPDETALTDGAAVVTWAELDRRVGALAARLRDAGAGPGDRVGVHLPKSVDSFVAVHAVLRAGAVMVPLDPLAPAEHGRRLLEEVGARILVSNARPASLDVLSGAPALVAVLGADDEGGAHGNGFLAAGESAVGPDDAAYVIPTSGSTGRPKAIVHTHRSALAYAVAAADTYGLTAHDRLTNIASLHFDQSTFELYAASLVGASVLVVPDAALRFPASVVDLVDRAAATVWYSVPYVLRQLVSRGALGDRRLSLRWILYGGESYPPDELAALMALVPDARVSNVYGPAEVNQCTFHHLVAPPAADRPVPIGRPWPAAEVVVVDPGWSPEQQPDRSTRSTLGGRALVADGATGELLVATPTMMRGYWGRSELTRAAVVEARFEGRSGSRWYRTGDLVTVRDGELVFAGRVDHQVKVRGQRVEPESVEAVLSEVPGVIDAAVVVDRSADEPVLVGLVVLEPGTDERAVRSASRRRLPPAAVPARWVVADSVPRSPNGKIDRTAVLGRIEPATAAGTIRRAASPSTERIDHP